MGIRLLKMRFTLNFVVIKLEKLAPPKKKGLKK